MFEQLTEELLDLRSNVRGYGGAMYAAVEDDPGCSCSGCTTVVLCCCCTTLCW